MLGETVHPHRARLLPVLGHEHCFSVIVVIMITHRGIQPGMFLLQQLLPFLIQGLLQGLLPLVEMSLSQPLPDAHLSPHPQNTACLGSARPHAREGSDTYSWRTELCFVSSGNGQSRECLPYNVECVFVSVFGNLVLTFLHSLTSPELGLLFYYPRAQQMMRGGLCLLSSLAAPTHHLHLHPPEARASLSSPHTLLFFTLWPLVLQQVGVPYFLSSPSEPHPSSS